MVFDQQFIKIMTDKKKRASKTSLQQYEIFIEELQQNTAFRTNKNSPENPNAIQDTWIKLTEKLNSIGGPCRTLAEWKRVYVDWKSHVKRKARLIRREEIETGNKPRTEKPLTNLESQLIDCIGVVTVNGMDVVEHGIVDPQSKHDISDNNIIITDINNILELPIEGDFRIVETHNIKTTPIVTSTKKIENVFQITETTTETNENTNKSPIAISKKRKSRNTMHPNTSKRTQRDGLQSVVDAVISQSTNYEQLCNNVVHEIKELKEVLREANNIQRKRNKIKLAKLKAKYNIEKSELTDSE